MRPYLCPYCNHAYDQVKLFKHFGNCGPAMIMLDERIAAQAAAFREMSDQEMEVQIGVAMNHLVNLYVQKHGTEPSRAWLLDKERLVRNNADTLRGKK